jgi:hypothetical protein
LSDFSSKTSILAFISSRLVSNAASISSRPALYSLG